MIGAILIILGVLFGLGIWFISAAGITACMLSSKISQYEERLSLSTKGRPRLLLPDALAAQAGMPRLPALWQEEHAGEAIGIEQWWKTAQEMGRRRGYKELASNVFPHR